jgi:hypothetical protein
MDVTIGEDLERGGVVREFTDAQGRRWRAELITHGRTSAYLNPRVHKPILQFSCLDARMPRRYVGYGGGTLDEVAEDDLRELLERASVS